MRNGVKFTPLNSRFDKFDELTNENSRILQSSQFEQEKKHRF